MTVVDPDEPREGPPEAPLHELIAEVLALIDIVVNHITPDEVEERLRRFLAAQPPALPASSNPGTRPATPTSDETPTADEVIVELTRREHAARREAESARAEAIAAKAPR